MTTLQQQFDSQHFSNDYKLVNGVAMHAENPENFHIMPDVLKRHVSPSQFVELRIDSPRFSVHEDAPEKCSCPSCNGELTKPNLKHDNPASLVPLPKQNVPSRGWGEYDSENEPRPERVCPSENGIEPGGCVNVFS